jgi:hypothetical protein
LIDAGRIEGRIGEQPKGRREEKASSILTDQ